MCNRNKPVVYTYVYVFICMSLSMRGIMARVLSNKRHVPLIHYYIRICISIKPPSKAFAPFLTMTMMMSSRRRYGYTLVVLLIAILSLCQHVVAQDDGICDCTSECEMRVLENAKTWTQRVAELEAVAQTERETHKQEMATLSAVLQESKEHSQASLERANSLRKEHDESLDMYKKKCQHDLVSCQEAQEKSNVLQARVEQLTLVEDQVETLKRQVETTCKGKTRLGKVARKTRASVTRVSNKTTSDQ